RDRARGRHRRHPQEHAGGPPGGGGGPREAQRPVGPEGNGVQDHPRLAALQDRKSTRLNSSHVSISYAVFCLKKKKKKKNKNKIKKQKTKNTIKKTIPSTIYTAIYSIRPNNTHI